MRSVEIRLIPEPSGRRVSRFPFLPTAATDSVTAAATATAAFITLGDVSDSITAAATGTAAFAAAATFPASITEDATGTAEFSAVGGFNPSVTAAADAAASFSAIEDVLDSFAPAATATADFGASVAYFGDFTAAATGAAAFVAHTILYGTVAAAATAAAAFAASVYRQITLPPSEAPAQSAAPTVTGGDPSMQLFIGGVNLSAYHLEENANIDSQTIGRWTARVSLFDNSGTVLALFAGANNGVGLSITIQEYDQKLFAGCVQSVAAQRYLGTGSGIRYDITATDKSGICDRRVVKKALYLASQDGADVVRDIVTNYLGGEGITTVNVPASLGLLGSDAPFNFQKVAQAFDEIATLTATVWWVDPNGDLHFSALVDLPPAPFGLTETSGNWRGLSPEQGPMVITDLRDYRNKQYAVSNLNVIPPGGSGSGPQTTETYVGFPQQAAFDAGLAYGYVLVNLPIATIVSLKINGVAKNPYDINNPASPPYGTNATDWYYYVGGQIVFPSFAPAALDVIEIIYVPQSQNVSIGEGVALTPVTASLGMCGSGLYEAVEQVQDISSRADLQAIAEAILAKAGGVPIEFQFQTDYHGFQPGQLLPVNIPLIGISSQQFLVASVNGKSAGSNLGHSCTFRWNVTARSNQDPGNWVKYFERMIRRTEQAKPILQWETKTFILGAGSSVAGGASLTNPLVVERSGRLYRMTIVASEPNTDQDLTITFKVNNLPVGSITLPGGTGANVLVIVYFDESQPIYVYKDDIVSVDALYTDIGGSAVAARNVTAAMEHII